MMMAHLAVPTKLFPPHTPLAVIESAFLRDDGLATLLVGEVREPEKIGIIDRSQFLTFLSGRLGYGRAIYSRKSLAEFDSPPALIVDATTSVADAANLAIQRGVGQWSDAVVVDVVDGYATVAAVNLFRHVTDELGAQLDLDHLTGLLNRRGFLDRLEVATHQSVGSSVLLLLDLDGFKLVNDALGHQVGDDLLRSTARRIERALPDAAVARMGGDEFAVLATQDPMSSPEELALALVQRLALPTQLAGTEVTVPASVGVTRISGGLSAEELLHQADVALYRAKGAGRNCYRMFDDQIRRDVQRQLLISQELRDAIGRHEVRLHYQPVVDLDSHRIIAYEALARWQSPSVGSVAPTEFIALAERTGLIVALGRGLLEQALVLLATQERAARPNIHVNLSRRELQQPDLVRVVGALLERTGIEPKQLVIEVTETSVAVDPTRMIKTLHELSALGLRIALDDFGAGATSLSNLWHFPLDIVKLDCSLIETLRAPGLEGQSAQNRVRAIIDLCHAHDLVVTAEGIEHPEQAEVLRRLGCDYAQGWYFGRPSPTLDPSRRTAGSHVVG